MRSAKGWYFLVIGLLIIAIGLGLMLGVTFISVRQMIDAFSGRNPNQASIILTIRAPRIAASLLCGAMLATAGAISQSAFRNLLADPSILGVSSAANLFVSLGLMLLPGITGGKFWWSLAGGCFALCFLISPRILRDPYRLMIVGVILMLTFSGVQQLFSTGAGSVSGSFNGITWNTVFFLVIVGTSGLLAAVVISPWANYLKLSGEQLKTKGVSALLMRLGLLAVMVYLSAGVTAAVGVIPFVGIVVVNIARYLVGRDYTTLMPMAMLLGALVMLVIDTLGRLIVLPSELPAATLMTVIGGPFLILLLQRKRFNGTKSG
jgi:iron complex transport system permease protein